MPSLRRNFDVSLQPYAGVDIAPESAPVTAPPQMTFQPIQHAQFDAPSTATPNAIGTIGAALLNRPRKPPIMRDSSQPISTAPYDAA